MLRRILVVLVVVSLAALHALAADPPAPADAVPPGALARLGTLQWRHPDPVTFVAFALDGQAVMTAGADGTIRLWERQTGRELRRFARSAAPSPGPVAFRVVQPGVVPVGGGATLAVSPDGTTLASVLRPNVIQLWDLATGKEIRQLKGPPSGVATLLFSPDGKMLAARGGDHTIHLLDAEKGNEIRQLKGRPPTGNALNVVRVGVAAGGLAFAPDGKTLASAESEFEPQKITIYVKLSEVATGKEIRKIEMTPTGVSALAYSPDGKILAYASNNAIHLLEADSAMEIRRINVGPVTALLFAPDGQTLASKGRDQLIRLWQTSTGQELRALGEGPALPVNQVVFAIGVGNETRDLAFSADGKSIVTAAAHAVRLWDLATGQDQAAAESHRAPVTALTIAPGGKVILSRGSDNMLRRWEAGASRSICREPTGTIMVTFSADARLAALANVDGTIRLHDTETGKEMHRLKGHANGTAALAFAPDSKVLASRGSADNTIALFDAVQGIELRRLAIPLAQPPAAPGAAVRLVGAVGGGLGLAFSADGLMVATNVLESFQVVRTQANAPPTQAGGNRLRIWDVAIGKEIRNITLPAQRGAGQLAFAPDRRVLATENSDQTISLWEIASGKERGLLGAATPAAPAPGPRVLPAPPAVPIARGGPAVAAMAFSPDGTLLACRGTDNAIVVWDVVAGKEIGRLKGHTGAITTLAFSADGKTLASGSRDTTMLVWDVASLKQEPSPPPLELQSTEVAALWADLLGEQSAQAFRVILTLARAPGQVVPFLSTQLRPATPVDPQFLAGLLADLDSEQFQVRTKATEELAKLGDLAVPALQKLLLAQPTLETSRRATALLEKLTNGILTPEQVRLVRAVEVLERAATPDARRLLESLAGGAPGALPTREAQAALERLSRGTLPAVTRRS